MVTIHAMFLANVLRYTVCVHKLMKMKSHETAVFVCILASEITIILCTVGTEDVCEAEDDRLMDEATDENTDDKEQGVDQRSDDKEKVVTDDEEQGVDEEQENNDQGKGTDAELLKNPAKHRRKKRNVEVCNRYNRTLCYS